MLFKNPGPGLGIGILVDIPLPVVAEEPFILEVTVTVEIPVVPDGPKFMSVPC